MHIDESKLIESARSGDAGAFEVIINRYMPKALAYARQMTGNEEDAQDLVQDAFFKAYRSLDGFKGDSGFYTWFYRLLTNLCLDRLRKAAFLKTVFFFRSAGEDDENYEGPLDWAPDEHPASNPGRVLEQKELKGALNKALRSLPDRQRAVFLLRHGEGMKLADIAGVLGISEGAVKSHLVRAVAAMQKSMKGYV